MRRSLYSNTRCVDGRTFRHDPQHDDPDLETDIGQCPECEGEGCERAEGQSVNELSVTPLGLEAMAEYERANGERV